MSIQQVGGGFNSGNMPNLDPITDKLKGFGEHRHRIREIAFQQNLSHAHAMQRDAINQQFHTDNIFNQGRVQAILNDQQHENAKDFETHKTNEFGRALTKVGNYAKKNGAQVTNLSHGQTSFTLNHPPTAPATIPTGPPAQTNKPQPPPVGNGLSPQFSHINNAHQPQATHPLRPQP